MKICPSLCKLLQPLKNDIHKEFLTAYTLGPQFFLKKSAQIEKYITVLTLNNLK